MYGFFKLYETTPFEETRVLKPRSIFYLTEMGNSGDTFFIIDEDIANVTTSIVSANYTGNPTF